MSQQPCWWCGPPLALNFALEQAWATFFGFLLPLVWVWRLSRELRRFHWRGLVRALSDGDLLALGVWGCSGYVLVSCCLRLTFHPWGLFVGRVLFLAGCLRLVYVQVVCDGGLREEEALPMDDLLLLLLPHLGRQRGW